jgi:hypothetical protein
MLPAPSSSCSGWWFSQLWRCLLAERIERYAGWRIIYHTGRIARIQLVAARSRGEESIEGVPRNSEGRLTAGWVWPGEEGMRHSLYLNWQPGEYLVRAMEWARLRVIPPPETTADPVPAAMSLEVFARAWHNQVLDQIGLSIERVDTGGKGSRTRLPLEWTVPFGAPRLPISEAPCALSSVRYPDGAGAPALIVAGLTLPWLIDVDREAWPMWQRIDGDGLLCEAGGPLDECPRHGRDCPWPRTGSIAPGSTPTGW